MCCVLCYTLSCLVRAPARDWLSIRSLIIIMFPYSYIHARCLASRQWLSSTFITSLKSHSQRAWTFCKTTDYTHIIRYQFVMLCNCRSEQTTTTKIYFYFGIGSMTIVNKSQSLTCTRTVSRSLEKRHRVIFIIIIGSCEYQIFHDSVPSLSLSLARRSLIAALRTKIEYCFAKYIRLDSTGSVSCLTHSVQHNTSYYVPTNSNSQFPDASVSRKSRTPNQNPINNKNCYFMRK